jgi:hypothetical protein
MSKATEDTLGQLHELLAKQLADMIANGEVDPKTGQVVPASAATLNVARQFLKDNHITASEANKPMAELIDLPFVGKADQHGLQ